MRRPLTLLALGLGLGILAVMLTARLARPPLLAAYDFSRAVVDRDGNLLRLTLAADDTYRLYTPLGRISPQVVEATLLYEDRHFFRHPGVNPVALVKAFAHTYVTKGRRRGGSTITMQLARLRFRLDSRTLAASSCRCSGRCSSSWATPKHELLEAYLNLAPYGGNVQGVGAASRIYFHADAAMTLAPRGDGAGGDAAEPDGPTTGLDGGAGAAPGGTAQACRDVPRGPPPGDTGDPGAGHAP